MNYTEQFKAAEKAKTLKKLTPVYKAWDKKGEAVIGKYLDHQEVSSENSEKGYVHFLFEDDQGPIKFSMGMTTAKSVIASMEKGKVYIVRFEGKEKTSSGFEVNTFTVAEIPQA